MDKPLRQDEQTGLSTAWMSQGGAAVSKELKVSLPIAAANLGTVAFGADGKTFKMRHRIVSVS